MARRISAASPMSAIRKDFVEEIRSNLLNRRNTMAEGLLEVTHQMLDDEPNYTDEVDQASADTDKEIIVRIQNRDREILKQIDHAIHRIEIGAFGLCESCDEAISEARLKANPFSTLCIGCQTEMESEKQRFTARN